MDIGYIYIRTQRYYENEKIIKLGKTTDLYQRDMVYKTGEYYRGRYILICKLEEVSKVERILQRYLKGLGYHCMENGGHEFFKEETKDKIEEILIELGILYEKIDVEEVMKKIEKNEDRERLIEKVKNVMIQYIRKWRNRKNRIEIEIPIRPYDFQEEIIEKYIKYYETESKALLVLGCGGGKTLISLWMALRMGIRKLLIGVPNLSLLYQWNREIEKVFGKSVVIISVYSNMDDKRLSKRISKHLDKIVIVVTTYASAYKVERMSRRMDYEFDMMILDECHHLTLQNMEHYDDEYKRNYIKILKVKNRKQLGLTATLKEIKQQMEYTDEENRERMRENPNVISNTTEEYFGKILDRICLYQTIQWKKVCDYEILTMMADEESMSDLIKLIFENNQIDIGEMDENKMRLFSATYSACMSIEKGKCHHLLIYTNNKTNAKFVDRLIDIFMVSGYFNCISDSSLYHNYYISEHDELKKKRILEGFDMNRYGILTCVYCLGEGWDYPKLDGVVFAENMTSSIRIVQSALRSGRTNRDDPDKINKIIIPIFNMTDIQNEGDDFRKVREIVYQMGLEDETVMEKVKFYKMKPKNGENEEERRVKKKIEEIEFEMDETEMNELKEKIRMKRMERSILGMSYRKAKQYIRERGIQNRKEYERLCDRDNRFPRYPEEIYQNEFIGWLDYLGVSMDRYYQKDECIRRIMEIRNIDIDFDYEQLNKINVVNHLVEIDERFPPIEYWKQLYQIDNLNDIFVKIDIFDEIIYF